MSIAPGLGTFGTERVRVQSVAEPEATCPVSVCTVLACRLCDAGGATDLSFWFYARPADWIIHIRRHFLLRGLGLKSSSRLQDKSRHGARIKIVSEQEEDEVKLHRGRITALGKERRKEKEGCKKIELVTTRT